MLKKTQDLKKTLKKLKLNKMKPLLLFVSIVFFIGCSSEKELRKNNVVYNYSTQTSADGSPVGTYTAYRVNKNKKVEIDIT